MIKNILYSFSFGVIAFILSSFIFQVEENSEVIPWSLTRKLNWNDFQGSIDTTSNYKALTYSTVELKVISENKNEVKYHITNSFEIKLSWSKDKTSSNLLKHEQLHFDITELLTRKMKKQILSRVYENSEDFRSSVLKAFDEEESERTKLNALYDKETNHGVNKAKQQQWENKIQSEIKSLNKFADKEIIVKIK